MHISKEDYQTIRRKQKDYPDGFYERKYWEYRVDIDGKIREVAVTDLYCIIADNGEYYESKQLFSFCSWVLEEEDPYPLFIEVIENFKATLELFKNDKD